MFRSPSSALLLLFKRGHNDVQRQGQHVLGEKGIEFSVFGSSASTWCVSAARFAVGCLGAC